MRCSGAPMNASSGMLARSGGRATTSMSGWLPASACTHDAQPPQATSPARGRSQSSDLASASAVDLRYDERQRLIVLPPVIGFPLRLAGCFPRT